MPFQVSSGPIPRTDPSAHRVASCKDANRFSGPVCANPFPWFPISSIFEKMTIHGLWGDWESRNDLQDATFFRTVVYQIAGTWASHADRWTIIANHCGMGKPIQQ